jgi:hypothetical protein
MRSGVCRRMAAREFPRRSQRVTVRRTRGEHMFSASPPIAAGSEPCQHLRSAPGAVIRWSAVEPPESTEAVRKLRSCQKMAALSTIFGDSRTPVAQNARKFDGDWHDTNHSPEFSHILDPKQPFSILQKSLSLSSATQVSYPRLLSGATRSRPCMSGWKRQK